MRGDHGTRGRVLKALDALLTRTPVESLSIREVARQAKVSHALPSYHFGDKRGLLTAFAAEGYRILSLEITETLATHRGEPVYHRVALIGQIYVKFALRNPNHFFIMFQYEGVNAEDPDFKHYSDIVFRSLYESISSYFPAGDNVTEKRLTALSAWAIVHGLAMLMIGSRARRRMNISHPNPVIETLTTEFAKKYLPPR